MHPPHGGPAPGAVVVAAPTISPPAQSGAAPPAAPGARDDVIAIEHETFGRAANIFVTVAPIALLGVAIWRAWGGALHWQDLLVMGVGYALTGLGITIGFHRLFTHRSFKTSGAIRVIFAVLGSAAVEGPLIEWVSNHRMHHRFSDRPGDPHSPHLDEAEGWRGAFRGLLHAHAGWLIHANARADPDRYAPDLMADRAMRLVDRTFVVWVLAGLAVPFGLGVALMGTVSGGLEALLWGGVVRILLLHHATFSINSLCHFFGHRAFETGDESRNLAWLSLLTFGEAWHNNHHAFPTSAHHGLKRWQLDPGGWTIDALARCGLVWDVVRISPATQLAKVSL